MTDGNMAVADDDRLQNVVPFIQEHLELHRHGEAPERPKTTFILGINGIQGCGKSTLVEKLQATLKSHPHSLRIVVFSIDDLYLTHAEQLDLARNHPNNPLVQHRGQPSTHDVELCAEILDSLKNNQRTVIPCYNKSAFDGQGDRSAEESVVIEPSGGVLDLVILEGWFMGFRALGESVITARWHELQQNIAQGDDYNGRLGHNTLENILFINEQLKRYDQITDRFDALVHIDAEDIHYVYDWRLEAEHAMIRKKGSGMTDSEVRSFVDGYYPSYELYTEALRRGAFKQPGKQLRLVVDRNRKVTSVSRT